MYNIKVTKEFYKQESIILNGFYEGAYYKDTKCEILIRKYTFGFYAVNLECSIINSKNNIKVNGNIINPLIVSAFVRQSKNLEVALEAIAIATIGKLINEHLY